jgi:nucleoside-triphosphatase THEP1
LQKRYSELINIKLRVISKRRNTAIRFAPFGVGITGPSGVGKSTLAKLVMKTSLNAMGFDSSPERIITRDSRDKYDSVYTSDINGVYIDDVGSEKAEFSQISPVDIIIKFFNNMAAQAVKAELNAKGVVFIDFKVGVMTSNFVDYAVREYSNYAAASLRRFVHTRARVKNKYRKTGSVSLNTHHPELTSCALTKDVWDLDLEECHVFESKEGQSTYSFRIMTVTTLDGRKVRCKNLDLPTYLDVIIALSIQHKKSQDNVIKRSLEFDNMEMCKTCFRPSTLCACEKQPEPPKTHSSDSSHSSTETIVPHSSKSEPLFSVDRLANTVVDAVIKASKNYVKSWFGPLDWFNWALSYQPVRKMTTARLAKEFQAILDGSATNWLIALTPQWLFETSFFQAHVQKWQQTAALYDLRTSLRRSAFISGCVGLSAWFHPYIFRGLSRFLTNKRVVMLGVGSAATCTYLAYMHAVVYQARLRFYEKEYMRRRNALPALATSLRDGYASKVGFAATTLIVGLKLFQMWNENRLKTQPNSVLSPDKIDAHKEGWAGALLRSIGFKATTTPTMKHATSPQLIDAFKKNNLFWADITRPNGESCGCNIFFPRKNVAWLPYHVFFPRSEMHSGGQDPTKYFPFDDLTVKVNRGGNKPGSIFTFKCSLSMSVVSNEHDLVCIYVPNCPDLKTRLNMLPLTRPEGSGLAKMMYRNAQSFLEEKVTIHYGSYSHEYLPFYGGKYTTSLAKPGFCMGLAIADTKDPFIAGFHIAGRARAKEGYCQTVTLSEAEQLIKKLSEVRGVVLSTESGTLPAEQYGRKVLTSEAIHCHSMPAKLPATAYVDVLGSTKLRTQQKSVVKPSPISESVKQHFGVENTWGPPQLRPNWKAYNNTLEYVVDPADMFPPADVEFARRDWIEPLLDKMTDYVQTEDFRPLTDKESILGIPGRRFLEPIPMLTSMGFPVFGKKKNSLQK